MNILFLLLQIIFLEGILSVDNALAIAGIAEELPKDAITPLPFFLQKIFGKKQRESALKVGILGAYIGRGLLLFFVGFIISFPFLKFVGALYLFYLVGTHFFNFPSLFNFNCKGKNNFIQTVLLVEISDIVFSLDNVVATVSITSNMVLVIVGVFIGILLMRFAAQVFMKMIEFEPRLEHAAYVLIGVIGIELLLNWAGIDINSLIKFGISLCTILSFLIYGQLSRSMSKTVQEVK